MPPEAGSRRRQRARSAAPTKTLPRSSRTTTIASACVSRLIVTARTAGLRVAGDAVATESLAPGSGVWAAAAAARNKSASGGIPRWLTRIQRHIGSDDAAIGLGADANGP